MDIGIALPQWGKHASPQTIALVAQRAEDLGCASVWVQERLLRPTNPAQPYGGVPGLAWPEAYRTVYDPIETLTYVAAKTTTVKLGTSIIDSLFHTPVILAKRLATLDQFSNGRVIAGLGQGWSDDEFATSNVPPKRRGAGFEEMIHAIKAVWGPNPVSYSGRHYHIPESEIGPKPVQPGGPPIFLGAFVPAAIERAGRLADGFNPIALTWEMLEGSVAGFRAAARTAGRDADALPIIVRANCGLMPEPLGADRGAFWGSVEQIKEDLDRVAGMGMTHTFVDFGFIETPVDAQLRALEKLVRG